jgi:hypothetical protein
MKSESYQKFLGFFKSMGKERLDGLDYSYFKEMSKEEKSEAFVFLKEKMHKGSDEAIRGLWLLSEQRAYPEFKSRYDYLEKHDKMHKQMLTLAYYLYLYDKDNKYQFNITSFLYDNDKYVRLSALSFLNQTEKTGSVLSEIENVFLNDCDADVSYSACRQILDGYGIRKDDATTGGVYKNHIAEFISSDRAKRNEALKWLKANFTPH